VARECQGAKRGSVFEGGTISVECVPGLSGWWCHACGCYIPGVEMYLPRLCFRDVLLCFLCGIVRFIFFCLVQL